MTFTYRRGQELPGITLTWLDAAGDPIEFIAGYTFRVQLAGPDGTIYLTKTTGIAGGSGTVTITWADGELDLEPGAYRLLVTATAAGFDRAFNPGNPPVVRIVGPGV
jgi:hypothetical protein